MYVPNNPEQFRASMEEIARITQATEVNKLVILGNTAENKKALSEELHERIFPRTPESVGTARLLRGFTKAQEASIDPSLPRIIDVRYTVSPDAEKPSGATCANLVRKLLFQSINTRDAKPGERRFFRKENVDAWMLPGELKKIDFIQALNLMGNFAPDQVGSRDPIDSDKHKEYEE